MEAGTINKASSGNSKLRNETSATANVTLEYYTKGIGQFSVSAYRRDFKNMLRSIKYIVPAGGSWNGEPLPDTLSPTDDWEISTYDNVGKAHMSSVEFQYRRTLDFLPHPFNRISFNTNYTRLYFDRYENFMGDNGIARNFANLNVVIPYKDVRLRWNINWREGRRATTASNGWSQYNREVLTHTMDLTWQYNRTLEFYLNARNIFNQDAGTYLGRSDVRSRWVKTGAIWSAGVSADF
jgi:outer membrane receptor protein involved in Fe transport